MRSLDAVIAFKGFLTPPPSSASASADHLHYVFVESSGTAPEKAPVKCYKQHNTLLPEENSLSFRLTLTLTLTHWQHLSAFT